jgi:hypothetical protein
VETARGVLGGGMWVKNHKLGMWAAGLLGVAGIVPASAELPGLEEKEWLGYFVGFQNKKFQFAVTSQGKATIKVIGKKGEPLNKRLAIPVEFLVEEIRPDGKISVKKLKPETLESVQPATNKPQQIVIHGKVAGEASFEISINEDHGVISLGGRLLDLGTLTKNPLRFSIQLSFPDAYPNDKATGDKKEEKELREKTKNDRLQLNWTDGTRVKPPTDKPVDAGSKAINGPGISAMQVEFSSYDEKKFEFTASESSSITLSGPQSAPLYEGFVLTWMADPAKDPGGKARLSFEVK